MIELLQIAAIGTYLLVKRALDQRLHRHQRQALDVTIEWAYAKGLADGYAQRDVDDGMALIVQEYRAKFGDKAREVYR